MHRPPLSHFLPLPIGPHRSLSSSFLLPLPFFSPAPDGVVSSDSRTLGWSAAGPASSRGRGGAAPASMRRSGAGLLARLLDPALSSSGSGSSSAGEQRRRSIRRARNRRPSPRSSREGRRTSTAQGQARDPFVLYRWSGIPGNLVDALEHSGGAGGVAYPAVGSPSGKTILQGRLPSCSAGSLKRQLTSSNSEVTKHQLTSA
jgi:hypothetical protein